MKKHKFTWTFGSGRYIDVFQNGIACAHFNYDKRLKFDTAWSVTYLNSDQWEQVLVCVREAKAILKKIKRL